MSGDWGLFALALALVAVGVLAIAWAWWARSTSGLPPGRVIYADTSRWQRTRQPLFSRRHRLTGKPDYVVQEARALIPVEVKSSRAPGNGPRAGHVLQLGAYCLLVQETQHTRPPYGILQYADKTFRIEYTADLEAQVVGMLRDMRRDLARDGAHRNHNDPARCRRCGVRDSCDESLI